MLAESKNNFDSAEIERIKKRFNDHAVNGKMTKQLFKKSMGLLGIGQCEFLCNRIYPLITDKQSFGSKDFIQFLTHLTYGKKITKAKISFDFLDRDKKGYITKDDIEIVISQVSFMWNFLTGEKISISDSIKIICQNLHINEKLSITFEQYMDVYENQIDWYDYFNSKIQPINKIKRIMNVSQVQEYLKLLHHEIQSMMIELKQGQQTQDQTDIPSFLEISDITGSKGPLHLSSQQFKPRGDMDTRRESLTYQRASTLSRNIQVDGSSKLQVITNKLQKFQQISYELFPEYNLQKIENIPHLQVYKKKAIQNITQPEQKRQNIVYFGHQNWNIMLNMMLGLRNSLKSHFFKYQENVLFTEEDLNCKYYNQLIYKQNNKSIKEICELFVDYAPKVFFYIRKWFRIDNQAFLKSIGLQYLIGNLLMGNLSTLTDQTSEGKSGSFIYYTQDTKLIVKSISRQQYVTLKLILPQYVRYVQNNPNTFLLHIYGLYKLKNKLTNRQIYFIVINNFFETSLKIDERYDIKGSTHNRHTINQNMNTVLKDVDLINNHDRNFSIESQTKAQIYDQVIKDAQFLSKNNITEYSLLVGIHKTQKHKKDNNFNSKTASGFKSINGKQVFFFGIIDILTEYSAKKFVENHVLHIFNSDISCLPPQEYNQRFRNFIYKYIFSS